MTTVFDTAPRITKKQLRKARVEDVQRLARALRFKHIDSMSHRQLIRLLDWYFKRPMKKRFGMTLDR